MTDPIGSVEVVTALLLVKAVLAILAVLLFIYYKTNWDRAKKHLPIHFFYAKWRSVKHAVFLGLASLGFAIGFAIELAGAQYGLSMNLTRFISGIFETGSMLCMLYVFFTLALEDVPHFQHIAESAQRPRQQAPSSGQSGATAHQAAAAKAGKKAGRKARAGGRKKGKKR